MKMGKSSKSQVPSSKEAPNFKFQNGIEAIGGWDSRRFWNLEFGTWNFKSCLCFFASVRG
jgi:hypothetical protein